MPRLVDFAIAHSFSKPLISIELPSSSIEITLSGELRLEEICTYTLEAFASQQFVTLLSQYEGGDKTFDLIKMGVPQIKSDEEYYDEYGGLQETQSKSQKTWTLAIQANILKCIAAPANVRLCGLPVLPLSFFITLLIMHEFEIKQGKLIC
jgi:hypothetical protein